MAAAPRPVAAVRVRARGGGMRSGLLSVGGGRSGGGATEKKVSPPGTATLRGWSHGAATGMVVSAGAAVLEGMTVRSGREGALLY